MKRLPMPRSPPLRTDRPPRLVLILIDALHALGMSDLEANRQANRARDDLLHTVAQANVSAA